MAHCAAHMLVDRDLSSRVPGWDVDGGGLAGSSMRLDGSMDAAGDAFEWEQAMGVGLFASAIATGATFDASSPMVAPSSSMEPLRGAWIVDAWDPQHSIECCANAGVVAGDANRSGACFPSRTSSSPGRSSLHHTITRPVLPVRRLIILKSYLVTSLDSKSSYRDNPFIVAHLFDVTSTSAPHFTTMC
jgi:hypothetical protein